jgi:hypothetical protein
MFEKKQMNKTVAPTDRTEKKSWLKRVLVGGFLFFLIKGLIWLAVFFGLGTAFL